MFITEAGHNHHLPTAPTDLPVTPQALEKEEEEILFGAMTS